MFRYTLLFTVCRCLFDSLYTLSEMRLNRILYSSWLTHCPKGNNNYVYKFCVVFRLQPAPPSLLLYKCQVSSSCLWTSDKAPTHHYMIQCVHKLTAGSDDRANSLAFSPVTLTSCFLLQVLTCFLDTTACGGLSFLIPSCATQWSSTRQTHTLLLWAARPSHMSTPPATPLSSTPITSQIHSVITEAPLLTRLVEGHCFHHRHCLHCYLLCLERHHRICSWYWAVN